MSAPDTRLVTPEAVVLDLETAGLGSRLVARAVDELIKVAVLLVLFLVGALVGGAGLPVPGWLGISLVLFLVFGIYVGYDVAFETLWRGRTPGKAIFGLRVVTADAAPVRFRHAALRAALATVDIYLCNAIIGIVAILASARNQRLGDLVGGTLVLRERTGAAMPTPVAFSVPYGYEAYAATLDPSAMSAQDYGVVRSFLLRAPTLTPQLRDQLARQVAAPLAARLHHTPPPAVSPETFLVALAARYQQRSLRQPGDGVDHHQAQPAQPSPPPPQIPPPPRWSQHPGSSQAPGFDPPA